MRTWLRRRWLWVGIVLIVALVGALLLLWFIWRARRGAPSGGPLPTPLPRAETLLVADTFDYPLDPARFGPYVQGETGPLPVDTRFDVQNPGLGRDGKCFVSLDGEAIPFERLWHAGEDWFAYDARGQVQGGAAAGEPVRAVAHGVVTWAQALGSEGNVLVVAHRLPDDVQLWSVYWHLADVEVAVGEAVTRGQPLGVVHDRGFNSHLHWEIRTFADGSALFPDDSAGGRGRCNRYVMGVGYTWDDDLDRAHPQAWGYLHPSNFVAAHRAGE